MPFPAQYLAPDVQHINGESDHLSHGDEVIKDFDFCPGGCLFSLGSLVVREASCQVAGCKQPNGGVCVRIGAASYQQL